MSTPPDRGRNKVQQPAAGAKGTGRGPLISAIVAVVAVIGIILYAWWHAHSAVPGAAVATNPQATFPPITPAGSKAPPFTLKAPLDTITSSSLAGKPYLLEIFATWCPHCQRMTKVLGALHARFPTLTILSVTGSPYAQLSTPDNTILESQQDVDAFDHAFNVAWPSIFDPDLAVARTWGLDGFPTIYIVNRKGIIVYSGSGEISQNVLAAAVRKAGG